MRRAKRDRGSDATASTDFTEDAFDAFASEWMAKVRSLEEKHRANPTVKKGASDPVVTYRGYGEDPDDRHIRLAPSFPPLAEVEAAVEVFVVAVQLASVRAESARRATA